MNNLFRNVKKYLLAILIITAVSCDKEGHEPFKACQGVDANQFPFIDWYIGSYYWENIKIWPYDWPYQYAWFQFSADQTFIFEADFPCDSDIGLLLQCDETNQEGPFAPLQFSGIYEFSQNVRKVPVEHFGNTNSLSGSIIIKVQNASISDIIGKELYGSYNITCSAQKYYSGTLFVDLAEHWRLVPDWKLSINIPIKGITYKFYWHPQ